MSLLDRDSSIRSIFSLNSLINLAANSICYYSLKIFSNSVSFKSFRLQKLLLRLKISQLRDIYAFEISWADFKLGVHPHNRLNHLLVLLHEFLSNLDYLGALQTLFCFCRASSSYIRRLFSDTLNKVSAVFNDLSGTWLIVHWNRIRWSLNCNSLGGSTFIFFCASRGLRSDGFHGITAEKFLQSSCQGKSFLSYQSLVLLNACKLKAIGHHLSYCFWIRTASTVR